MQGKICLITGANAGIGKAVALELARRRATVVLLCRDGSRGLGAVDELAREVGHERVHLVVADLASRASILDGVESFLTRFDRLDLLINNAGTTSPSRQLTVDGLETTFAVNYLGHFLLTVRLLERLKASRPARIVNLAGIYHRRGAIRLDDLQFAWRPYDWVQANYQSQLARVLFTVELARRLGGQGVSANCVHPGAVLTNAQRQAPWWARLLIHTVLRPGFVRPDRGAAPVVRLAVDPLLEEVTGRFFDRFEEAPLTGAAADPALARRLWEMSLELCGLVDPLPG